MDMDWQPYETLEAYLLRMRRLMAEDLQLADHTLERLDSWVRSIVRNVRHRGAVADILAVAVPGPEAQR